MVWPVFAPRQGRFFAAAVPGPNGCCRVAPDAPSASGPRRILLMAIALLLSSVVVTRAQTSQPPTTQITFDLSTTTSQSTPVSQTVQGVTATFSSPADPGGFSLTTADVLHLYIIGPNILADGLGPAGEGPGGIPLNITFSRPVQDVALQFATWGESPFVLQAFSGGNPVGTQTCFGVVSYYEPEGVCTFTPTASGGFDSLVLEALGTPYFAIANVSVTVTGSCTANAKREMQNDKTWGGDFYDHSSVLTIASDGCGLTSLSMALNEAGAQQDPRSLNNFMKNHDTDFKGTHVWWTVATRDFSGGALEFNFNKVSSVTDLESAKLFLDNALCQAGKPVVVGVKLMANGTPGHYVLVTGKQDTDYTIIDPNYPKRTLLSQYNNRFETRGYVTVAGQGSAKTLLSQYNNRFETRGYIATPPGDISELDLAVGNRAEFLVIDSLGRKTGYDPSVREIVEEIPGSVYYRDALENDITGQPPDDTAHFANISRPAQGTYQIVVSGLELGTYSLSCRMFAQDGSPQSPVTVMGIAGVGSSSTLSIEVNPEPGAQTVITVVATFSSTLADISKAFQLGLIDNQGIAKSLTSKIETAQQSAARGNYAAVRNQLEAFKNEVNAQTGKHITGVAPVVLLQDADSLINQNP
jgi:hypothetical protein